MSGSSADVSDDIPYNHRRGIWTDTEGSHNSSHEFGEMYNVHAWVLPFSGRVTDPMYVLSKLSTYLGNRPRGSQRVTRSHIQDYTEISKGVWSDTEMMDNLFLIHGWWRGGKTSSGPYYCNPDYYHRHPETDIFVTWDDRKSHLEDAASLGIVDPRDIAPAFGHQAKNAKYAGNCVTSVANTCDFPWGERRDAGRHRLFRTWATLSKWGYSKADIGRAFGISRPTVSKGITRTEFHKPIPDDPTVEVMKCL